MLNTSYQMYQLNCPYKWFQPEKVQAALVQWDPAFRKVDFKKTSH